MGAFDEKAPITIPELGDIDAAKRFRAQWGWDEHEQVLLKGTVTVADQEYVSNRYIKSDKKGDMEMQAGTGRYALLDRMILDWTFHRNGQKVRVTPEAIRQLPVNYSNPILERIDLLSSTMTEQEQEDFLDSQNEHILMNSEQSLVKLHR